MRRFDPIEAPEEEALDLRIAEKFNETPDICRLKLVSLDGRDLPDFSAGSHIEIEISPEFRRAYSLCNGPKDRTYYEIAVLRDPNSRGGSSAVHDRLRPGDVIRASQPRNFFPLSPRARKSLLLAGGIGVTPMLAMAETLASEGKDFQFHYCARSRDQMAFVERISKSPYSDRCHFHYDDDPASQFDVEATLSSPRRDKHLYVCGPAGFITFVLENGRRLGWNDVNMHYEFFGAAIPKRSDDGAFDLKIASTGEVLRVPSDRTALSVLHDHGFRIPVSCEQGVCGSCRVKVRDGIPEHRDNVLTAQERAENSSFLPCVSRSISDSLILDL